MTVERFANVLNRRYPMTRKSKSYPKKKEANASFVLLECRALLFLFWNMVRTKANALDTQREERVDSKKVRVALIEDIW